MARRLLYPYALLMWWLAVTMSQAAAVEKNGFRVENPLVPVNEIRHGGPPRDGIPALYDPTFLPGSDASFLAGTDYVLGLELNGIARAYPIRILNYHEVVNDDFDGTPVIITYCPLCGSGMAFSAIVGGSRKLFGVSGLLYNSDVLLYDRETESLWSQIMGQAVSGPLKGQRLKQLALFHTTWEHWKSTHPETEVLSTKTGHFRNYERDPYREYRKSADLMFPVGNRDRRYGAKDLVIGLELDGRYKAYPFHELPAGQTLITDAFAGNVLTVEYDKRASFGKILDENGTEIPSVILYWFAWAAFHPDTAVYGGAGVK